MYNDALEHCSMKAFGSGEMCIGKDYFSQCTSLTSVTAHDYQSGNTPRYVFMGENAFAGCTNLTDIEPVIDCQYCDRTIPAHAFQDCNKLTGLTISPSITKIGEGAFSFMHAWTPVFPTNVAEIGPYAYRECNFQGHVEWPSGIIKMEEGVLEGTPMTSINIPDSVTIIKGNAVKGGSAYSKWSSQLSAVTIGTGIKDMSAFSSFSDNPNLVSFTVKATIPPLFNASVLWSANKDLVIYVPAESVDAYKAATNWSQYASKIQAIPTT